MYCLSLPQAVPVLREEGRARWALDSVPETWHRAELIWGPSDATVECKAHCRAGQGSECPAGPDQEGETRRPPSLTMETGWPGDTTVPPWVSQNFGERAASSRFSCHFPWDRSVLGSPQSHGPSFGHG